MSPRLVTVSKFLAKHLRHTPEKLGLELAPGGWVSVDELLEATNRSGFALAYDELLECVESNDKQRFSFDDTGDRIRANQGHSVTVDLKLQEQVPPEVLYHGTVESVLDLIFAGGLKKMKRHHVHLSVDVVTARKVGARRGQPVILRVDAMRMHADGHTFFVSANGVWLTDHVPTRYLTREE